MAFPIIPKRDSVITYPVSRYDPCEYDNFLLQMLPKSIYMRRSVEKFFDVMNVNPIILYSNGSQIEYKNKIFHVEDKKLKFIEEILEVYKYLFQGVQNFIENIDLQTEITITMETDLNFLATSIVFRTLKFELRYQGYSPQYDIETDDGFSKTNSYVHKLYCAFKMPDEPAKL